MLQRAGRRSSSSCVMSPMSPMSPRWRMGSSPKRQREKEKKKKEKEKAVAAAKRAVAAANKTVKANATMESPKVDRSAELVELSVALHWLIGH